MAGLTDYPPTLSFVVSCKGRLAHLQQSLPRLATQSRSEVVLVDSSCPDGAAAWAEKHVPSVKVVRHVDDGRFNLAVCRNRGLQETVAPWVCFVDADVVLVPDFVDRIAPLLVPGSFLVFEEWHEKRGLTGSCVVPRNGLDLIGGYDEAYQGWGEEDLDLYMRLELRGLQKRPLSHDLAEYVIQHDDAQRVAFHDQKSIELSHTIAALYRAAKYEFLTHAPAGVATPAQQSGLFQTCRGTIESALALGSLTAQLTINLPDSPAMHFLAVPARRKIVLEVALAPYFAPQSQ